MLAGRKRSSGAHGMQSNAVESDLAKRIAALDWATLHTGLDARGFAVTGPLTQRPRMQSRAQVVPLRRGEGVIFAVHQRPVRRTRGTYRVNLRHGVSEIRRGQRMTARVIFHDAA
jgi:hypothetical protein